MSFIKKNKKSKFHLLLDIRSSSIGLALIEINKQDFVIHFEKREHIFFKEAPEPNEYINTFSKKTKNIIENFSNIILPKIITDLPKNFKLTNVEIFFGAPWYDPKIKNLKIKEKKPITFSHKYLDNLINTDNFKKTIFKNTDNEIIENKIISVLMNGYELEEPFGKKSDDLEISFYLSEINQEMGEMFEDIVSKIIPSAHIQKHSHALAVYSYFKNYFHANNNFMIFDISGELIEIILVKNYQIDFIISVPFGTHYLIRDIIGKKKIEEHLATSTLKNYFSDNLDKKTHKKIKDLLSENEEEFTKKVSRAINENKKDKLPNDYFVISDGEFKKIISKILSSSEFYSKINATKKPRIFNIRDSMLSLEASYINLLSN